ncbi:hypothetical protein [Lysobacter tyrosinilyticus]
MPHATLLRRLPILRTAGSCKLAAIALFCVCLLLWGLAAGTTWLGWPIHPRVIRTGLGVTAGVLLASAMLWFSPGNIRDMATPALTRRYYREFGPPMLAYVVVMLGWKRVLAAVDASWLRALVALLPVLLMALVIRALARYVRDSDEMQRRIELESVSLAAGLVGIGYMAAGSLQGAKLITTDAAAAMLGVFPALCVCYGFIRIVIARRYT